MWGNVGTGTAESAVVEIVGVAVGISSISHSVAEIQCTSGLLSAIFNFWSWRMSGNVGSGIIGLAVVENGGIAVGITLIPHSVAEIQCTSGLMSAILNFWSRWMSGNVGSNRGKSAVVGTAG